MVVTIYVVIEEYGAYRLEGFEAKAAFMTREEAEAFVAQQDEPLDYQVQEVELALGLVANLP